MTPNVETTISFDLDRVLLPEPLKDTVFADLVDRLAQEVGPRWGWSPMRAREEIRRRVWQEFTRQSHNGHHSVEAFDWDANFGRVAQVLGATQAIDTGSMVKEFCQHPQDIPAYPEVPQVLEELQHRGVRLLVITNGYARYQMPLLRALGLAPFFHRIVTCDQAGHTKPARAIYRHAFANLNGRKIHVGDRLLHDVYGARRAGLEAVWLNRCLPAGIDGLPPAARLISPLVTETMRNELIKEEALDDPLKAYRPDYVLRDLRELPSLLFSNAIGKRQPSCDGQRSLTERSTDLITKAPLRLGQRPRQTLDNRRS